VKPSALGFFSPDRSVFRTTLTKWGRPRSRAAFGGVAGEAASGIPISCCGRLATPSACRVRPRTLIEAKGNTLLLQCGELLTAERAASRALSRAGCGPSDERAEPGVAENRAPCMAFISFAADRRVSLAESIFTVLRCRAPHPEPQHLAAKREWVFPAPRAVGKEMRVSVDKSAVRAIEILDCCPYRKRR